MITPQNRLTNPLIQVLTSSVYRLVWVTYNDVRTVCVAPRLLFRCSRWRRLTWVQDNMYGMGLLCGSGNSAQFYVKGLSFLLWLIVLFI